MLIPTENSVFFGRLLFMFSFSVSTFTYYIALIQPYEIPARQNIKDKELGLLRVEKKRAPEFISLNSVIRGAVLAPAELGSDKEFLVVDAVDVDMFYRMKTVFPTYTTI